MNVPSEIINICEQAVNGILPQKSSSRYKNAYDVFTKWQISKGITGIDSFSESVLLAYFFEISKSYLPSTLWSIYSMLKCTIICNQNIDISKFSRLVCFLKTKSDGFKSKKSNAFTAKDIQKFLVEASDDRYLAVKTVCIFGVIGACRGDELANVLVDHIKDDGNKITVRIPDTKTKVAKVYSIDGEYGQIVRKYMKLRPVQPMTNRFFLQYRNGRCTIQVIGKNSIAKSYTGHSFRRTSTTILADNGCGIEDLKRHGNWKSTTVAEGYIAESMGNKRKIRNLIEDAINLGQSRDVLIDSDHYQSAKKNTATATTTRNAIIASQNYEDGQIQVDQTYEFQRKQLLPFHWFQHQINLKRKVPFFISIIAAAQ